MSVRRKMDVLAAKALGENNQDCNQKDNMIVKNRLTGKGHGLFEEGESWNNEDVDKRPAEVVKNQAIMHSQRQQWQQQPSQPLLQGPIVRWENFLPVRSLKVMLVENDDSTRHVVSALLRNCSYEVRAVSNGLEAWKILQDLTNHVDLVLTEVAMPGLSGIDLLSKIMSQKTCKNIPVIMMSSNDSMRVVFKCLSNGAVDFLVKPIRKNELKNLWQHVWRKCHSSSGSGSESGLRIEKSTKAKSVDDDESDNDTRSTDEEDSEESTGLMYKNGSDNNSGTQTSCSKKALEIQIQPISQQGYLADSPGSICAQVIHSNLEAQSSNWALTNVTKTFQKDDNAPDNVAMGKDCTIGTSRLLDTDVGDDENKQGKDVEVKYELQYKDNDNVINDVTDVSIPTANNEVTNDLPKITMVKNVDPCEEKEPSLELSLKKLRDIGNSRANSQGQNILIHSDHSAFSRYNTTLTTNQTLTLNLESSTPVNYSLEVPKTESIQHLQGQGSNGSSNSIDMGSTTNNNVLTNPESCNDKSIPRSTVSVHHRYAYQPVHHGHNNPMVSDAKKTVDTEKTPPVHQHTQVEHHHHHHYHHHHHHMHSSQNHHQQLPLNNDDSSDKLGMGIEGNNDNYSSALEISNGNSGQTRKGISGITEGTNMTNDNKPLGACASGSGSRSGLDQDRLSLREAALNKFRQKRKERCFEKKVRYQSRKTLAEQRPRVRGQFVRQAVDENIKKDENNYTNS